MCCPPEVALSRLGGSTAAGLGMELLVVAGRAGTPALEMGNEPESEPQQLLCGVCWGRPRQGPVSLGLTQGGLNWGQLNAGAGAAVAEAGLWRGRCRVLLCHTVLHAS